MSNNLERIRIRRGSNDNLLDSRVAKGQPVYNKTRNYLTINNLADNSAVYKNLSPINVRKILGYHNENSELKSEALRGSLYEIYGDETRLNILSGLETLLKGGDTSSISAKTLTTGVGKIVISFGAGELNLGDKIFIQGNKINTVAGTGNLVISSDTHIDIEKLVNLKDNMSFDSGKGFISDLTVGTSDSSQNLIVHGTTTTSKLLTAENGIAVSNGNTILKDVTSERPNVMPAPQGLGIPNVSNNISSEYYTIGDLKKFINDLPDETPVIISNPVGRGSNEDAHDAFYLKNVYMDEKGYAFMRGSETPPIDGFEIVQGLVVYGD